MVYIEGEVLAQKEGELVVVCGGVGYRVFVPKTFARADHVTLWLHESLRDTERELFGFESREALEFFWKLLGVSGVGARLAQKIVNIDALERVKAAIAAGQLSFLTSISGVGKKTAQKILLELKGVLAQEDEGEVADTEAFEALVSLGYKEQQAREALAHVEADTTQERIKQALRALH